MPTYVAVNQSDGENGERRDMSGSLHVEKHNRLDLQSLRAHSEKFTGSRTRYTSKSRNIHIALGDVRFNLKIFGACMNPLSTYQDIPDPMTPRSLFSYFGVMVFLCCTWLGCADVWLSLLAYLDCSCEG